MPAVATNPLASIRSNATSEPTINTIRNAHIADRWPYEPKSRYGTSYTHSAITTVRAAVATIPRLGSRPISPADTRGTRITTSAYAENVELYRAIDASCI